jgi:ABC-type antimicrobial peptide transport system permease subunit
MPVARYIASSLERPRFSLSLLGIFGALALTLAAVGMYGVSAYNGIQRKQEIGFRMALGAQPRDIMKFALGGNTKLILAGLAIGLAAAPALTPFLANQMYGETTHGPLSFAIVGMVLCGVALVACYIPARRATRVDATVSLRHQ